jgi:hypothetical protein
MNSFKLLLRYRISTNRYKHPMSTTSCDESTCMYVDAYMCHLNKFRVCSDIDCFNVMLDRGATVRHMQSHHPNLLTGPIAQVPAKPAFVSTEPSAPIATPQKSPRQVMPEVFKSEVPKASPPMSSLSLAGLKPASAITDESVTVPVKSATEPYVSPRTRGGKPQGALRKSSGRGRVADVPFTGGAPTFSNVDYSARYAYPQEPPQQYPMQQYIPQGYPQQVGPGGMHAPPGMSPYAQQPPMSPTGNITVPMWERHSRVWVGGCKHAEKLQVPFITPGGMVAGLVCCGAPIVPKTLYCEEHLERHPLKKPPSPKSQ